MDIPQKGDAFELYEQNKQEARRRQRFEWVPFERLRELYIYPEFIKEKVFCLPEELTLITEWE